MSTMIAGANYPLLAAPITAVQVTVQGTTLAGAAALGTTIGLVWIGIDQRREPMMTPAFLHVPTPWATVDGDPQTATWQLHLPEIAANIQSLMLVIYSYSSKSPLTQVNCQVSSNAGMPVYSPALADSRDSAMIIAEVYRRNGDWKFRALAEGSPYGLAALGRNLHLALDERAPHEQSAPESGSGGAGGNPSGDEPNMWTGSAFAITPQHVLTCAHVVEGASKIELKSLLGSRSATVVAQDASSDIALLAVDGAPLTTMLPIRHGQVGLLGEPLTTLGYPLSSLVGQNLQVTQGCVSSLRGTQQDIRFFQFTAPIQPGSSGSPVLDSTGQVLGMVTSSMIQAQNMNFAVKHHMIMAFLEAVGVDLPTATPRPDQGLQNYSSQNSPQLVRQAQAALWHVTCYR